MRDDQLLVSRTHAFSGTDVWDLVRMRAQRSADRIAFVWHPYHGSPRAWTYRELAAAAAGVAAGLQRRGTGPGRAAPEYQIAVVRDDGVTPVAPEETGHQDLVISHMRLPATAHLSTK
jgi:acyl-CoA synthetase (AMP-forming)/AMP-acid ligase II